MFTMTDFIVQGISGLIKAFESGFEIEGEVLNEAMEELGEYKIDSYYEDFSSAGRWTIQLAKIFQFHDCSDYFLIWVDVGLTEMQTTEIYDQAPRKVKKQIRLVEEWVNI